MKVPIPTLDLKAQFHSIESEIREAIDRVLTSQRFILGPEVEALEKAVATYVGCSHAVGVSSGSDALLISLMALGIGPGDEVITSPHTFFATVGAIARVGARPVFVDIEPLSFNLDPSKLEAAITPATRAAIPVHLFGQAAEMKRIQEICQARKIFIVEDAAQAIGTEYQGNRVGSLGDLACFSFFPSKNLGAPGDGGMVTTRDEALADRVRILRAHGSRPKYFHKYIGGNFRLDALHAAVLRAKFTHLDGWTEARQQKADRYDQLIKDANLTEHLTSPWRRNGDRHIFNQYVIRVPQKRDELKKHLAEEGISSEIYYPVPMHIQECFSYLENKEGDFPHAELAANESLAIPLYPEMTDAQQDRVVDTIRKFLG